MLISLDPGRAGLGWAAFSGEGRLLACSVVRQPKGPRDYEQASLEAVAANAEAEIYRAVRLWLGERGPGDDPPFSSCVVERMTSYPGVKTFVANDLLDLQAIGGMVAGALCPLSGVRWLRPSEWQRLAGSDDTQILEDRLLLPDQKAPSGWTAEERALVATMRKKYGKTLGHNGIDATSIGLAYLKRWRTR